MRVSLFEELISQKGAFSKVLVQQNYDILASNLPKNLIEYILKGALRIQVTFFFHRAPFGALGYPECPQGAFARVRRF